MMKKRTNVLFDNESWLDLKGLARQRKTSVGSLIRQAVKETYFVDKNREKIAMAVKEIMRIRKTFKKVDYEELINYGREV